ncbi:o-succinylbenzoate synthase [Agarivorans sp. Toyoura001]|uniref:o-succinylbenzoate synthase n=1 Tax=Agarivorans sp. Toyoura001 TaxID=2283141 RepID=UPI0010E01129|nr:o-succinylbenzoate synthase [Agarivorans sp. Toyoura001]GDY26975.1 o-succinylbenzoate synthase [Agarivorans sp. Toyoura001]
MLCNWQSATLSRYTQALHTPLQFGPLQITHRHGLYLELHFTDGRVGRGEIAPLPGFSDETLEQAEQQIRDYLQGHAQRKLYPSVAFGMDCAMAGFPPSSPIVSGYPLLNGDFAHCQQILSLDNTKLAKLKVARQSPKQDVALINQLLEHDPELRLRLDANRGWIWNQAIYVLENIDLSRIDYIEEPLMNSQQCALLAQRTGASIGLDETLQDSSYRYHYFEGLRCLVIKPSLLGPWRVCANLVEQAHADQVSCVLSSAYESEFGLQWINTMAKQYTPDQAPGLDTLKAFSEQAANIEVLETFQHKL